MAGHRRERNGRDRFSTARILLFSPSGAIGADPSTEIMPDKAHAQTKAEGKNLASHGNWAIYRRRGDLFKRAADNRSGRSAEGGREKLEQLDLFAPSDPSISC